MFAKLAVNGADTHPLYRYLKENQPAGGEREIGWNFTKFLVDRSGAVKARFEPEVEPAELVDTIESLLEQTAGLVTDDHHTGRERDA